MARNVVTHLIGALVALSLTAPMAAAKDHKHGSKGKDAKHGRADTAPGHAKHERRIVAAPDTAPRHAERRRVVVQRVPARDVIVIDRDGNRRVVTEFFRRESLPPGLAKRNSLPPGLAKHLRERGQLPPGLQKRLTPVPQQLVTQLPALPPHYVRYFSGRDLVVVDTRTNRVAAIIRDVLPR